VPLASDLTQDREKLQILKLFLASQETARPFAAPPDLPADRKATLIRAFDATMKDPEFLAEAQKLNMDINPLNAKGVDDILTELYATPKAVLDKAAQATSK
jgi:tripartite-type tricarboxylate transporter receptor subunit TctC